MTVYGSSPTDFAITENCRESLRRPAWLIHANVFCELIDHTYGCIDVVLCWYFSSSDFESSALRDYRKS